VLTLAFLLAAGGTALGLTLAGTLFYPRFIINSSDHWHNRLD